jgi:hypothetical protein
VPNGLVVAVVLVPKILVVVGAAANVARRKNIYIFQKKLI